MELFSKSLPARDEMTGIATFDIPAGKTLKVETFPAGEEIINRVVPSGKKWSVWINIDIVERNA